MSLGLFFVLLWASSGRAQNVLANSDFSEVSGNALAIWRTESWLSIPTTSFGWIPPSATHPGEVEIANLELNDARWTQSLLLDPGTYLVSTQVHAQGISTSVGAFISLGDEGVASDDVNGTGGWHRVGFFLQVPDRPMRVEVKLRLGGFQNFAKGQAFFRDARVTRIDSVPSGAALFNLEQIRAPWRGRFWTVIATFAALVISACCGWLMSAETTSNADAEP